MGIFSKLNLAKQCRTDFNVPVWKCPTFLFILMGLIVIVSIAVSYYVAATYGSDPEWGALAALITAAFIMIIGQIIIHSFTKVIEFDRLKAQFLNVVSHQLLTPLTSLKWSVSILETESLKSDREKFEEVAGIIKENSNRMIRIISTLLDVSRIETGKVVITPEPFDLSKAVREVLALRAGDLEGRRLAVEFQGDENAVAVWADPVRVKMVIENLVDNAIKYSKEGSSISISLQRKGDMAMFEIQDSGVGIPRREHKHVFGKFFRSGSETSLQTKGLGVGLFLVKFIIEASGGRVDFESQEGVGSRFWFSLPMHHAK